MTRAKLTDSPWPDYLAHYHRHNAGITELAFDRLIGEGPGASTPHAWLAEAVLSPGAVLDLGCGSAPMHDVLTHDGRYVGVDLSADELRVAQARERTGLIQADAHALPLNDSSVDTVVSSMAMMLVQPLEPALAEVSRVLSPSGTFAALTPSPWPIAASDLSALAMIARDLRGLGAMPQRIPARRWRTLLTRHHFTQVRTQRRLFRLPVQTRADAELAIRALYLPGRTQAQCERAAAHLTRWSGPGRTLPVPLLLVVARKGPDA